MRPFPKLALDVRDVARVVAMQRDDAAATSRVVFALSNLKLEIWKCEVRKGRWQCDHEEGIRVG